MAPPSLTSLPPEILTIITSCLPREDLLAARFISKIIFVDAAAPRLFRIIPLWISLKSLESLTSLALHSPLAVHVDEIGFSPIQINDEGYKSSQLAEIKKSIEFRTDSISSAGLLYGKYKSAFYSYTDAQRHLFEGSLYSDSWSIAVCT